MDKVEFLKNEASGLPLSQIELLLAEIENLVHEKYQAICDEAESRNLAIVQERVDELDSGEITSRPVREALGDWFGD
jgi:hypothetical protein